MKGLLTPEDTKYLALGVVFGVVIGAVTGHLALWIAVGIAIGGGLAAQSARRNRPPS